MIPLEDNFSDIIGKAQRGLRLTDDDLCRLAGITAADLHKAMSGQFDERVVRNLAPVLKLGTETLVDSGRQSWYPNTPPPLDGFASFNTQFGDMTVNAYLVWDTRTNQAAAFDTGSDVGPMLAFARDRKLALALIFLTHTHGDHVFDLARLKSATGAEAFVSKLEPISEAEVFSPGKMFELVDLHIETRLTSGHSRGGTTYVVTGLARRLAIVGDALFAGSMGGGMVSYEDALRNNREQILTLPDDTILCPGHGPLTTVREEKLHNPFFPEFNG